MKNSWHARGWEQIQSIGRAAGVGALAPLREGVAEGRAGRGHQSGFAFIPGFCSRVLGQRWVVRGEHTAERSSPYSLWGG